MSLEWLRRTLSCACAPRIHRGHAGRCGVETAGHDREGLERELKELEPDSLSLDDAVRLVRFFARVERLAAAGKALCANRCSEAGAHRRTGDRTAADWLAGETGDTISQAISALEAGKGAKQSGKLDEALRSGDLSQSKGGQLGQLADLDPAKADDLVDEAKKDSAADLRRKVEQRKREKASEKSEQERIESIRRRRYLRFYKDADGAGRIDGRLVPDEFALLKVAVEAVRERLYREARREGRDEPSQALMADALIEIVRGQWSNGSTAQAPERPDSGQPPSRPGSDPPPAPPSGGAVPVSRSVHRSTRATVRFIVDWEAFFRGEVREGEICEIPGVGPVPLSVARSVLGDAVCELVIKRGVDVMSVTHLGRYIPLALRRALDERDPRCVVPGCEMTRGLQAHHYRIDFHQFGPTELANLANVCVPHHRMATSGGFKLRGGPGRWRWVPPGQADPDDELGEPYESPQGEERARSAAEGEVRGGKDPPTLFDVAG